MNKKYCVVHDQDGHHIVEMPSNRRLAVAKLFEDAMLIAGKLNEPHLKQVAIGNNNRQIVQTNTEPNQTFTFGG